MDITEKKLPEYVNIYGKKYSIDTDFRVMLKFVRAIKQNGRADFLLLYNIYNGVLPKVDGRVDEAAAAAAIADFIQIKRELPREAGLPTTNEILIDYDIDAELIYSSFMKEYNIDLFSINKLHYYKFAALLAGLNNSKLVDVINIRQYQNNGKTDAESKYREKLKKAWRIIPEDEQQTSNAALKRFDEWLEGKRK